ncbi:putative glycosyltransferase [Ochrobactrum phage vB_OspM_OC]|nr:putative glycosyltransferase [Ochrobactrum phage vB_OspM_OC]
MTQSPTIDFDSLKGKSLFIATPAYGGSCNVNFAKSLLEITIIATKYQIPMKVHFIANESLITRARSYCCDEFKRSGMTHMLFIDADIEFNPLYVFYLMQLSETGSDYDILAATYPKKNIAWERVKAAVDRGYADENPNVLEHYAGDYVFNPLKTGSFKMVEPMEVAETGTGFMLFRKELLDDFDQAYPELLFKPDHVRDDNFNGSRDIMLYFQAEIDPESRRYLSEDYFFCQKARKLGKKVWILPFMNLNHIGTYVFKGNLGALAALT